MFPSNEMGLSSTPYQNFDERRRGSSSRDDTANPFQNGVDDAEAESSARPTHDEGIYYMGQGRFVASGSRSSHKEASKEAPHTSLLNPHPTQQTDTSPKASESARPAPFTTSSPPKPYFVKGTRTDISNGPLLRRGCKDIFGLLISGGLLAAFIALCIETYARGDLSRLRGGLDYTGKVCGQTAGVQEYPYLYWPSRNITLNPRTDPLAANQIAPVCTKECPSSFSLKRPGECPRKAQRQELCSWYGQFGTLASLNRYCFFRYSNDSTLDARDIRRGRSKLNWLDLAMSDILSARVLLMSTPAAIAICGLCYLYLIRQLGGSVVWASLVVVEGLLVGVGVSEWWEGTKSTAATQGDMVHVRVAMGAAYTCWSIAALLPIILCCMRKRLVLAARIVAAASKYLEENPSAPVVPLVTTVGSAVWHVGFALIALHHYTTGTVKANVSEPYETIHWSAITPLLLLIDISVFAWSACFVSGITQIIIAHSVGGWYFAPLTAGGRRYVRGATVHGTFTTFAHHIGSAAVGALLLPPAQFAKIICWPCGRRRCNSRNSRSSDRSTRDQVTYAASTSGTRQPAQFRGTPLKGDPSSNDTASHPGASRGDDASTNSTRRNVETPASPHTNPTKCHKFYESICSIEREGYVQVGLSGDHFIASSFRSADLCRRNWTRFSTIRDMNRAFQWLGRLLVVLVTVTTSLLVMRHVPSYRENLASPGAPLAVVIIQSWVYSTFFLHVWLVASECVLHCHIIDEELAKAEHASLDTHI